MGNTVRTGVRPGHPRFTPTHVGNTRDDGRFVFWGGGSPPRTWGIHANADHAGLLRPVHPHARGEYALESPAWPGGVGSPPRTWGILPLSLCRISIQRFTPTHVGNTPTTPSSRHCHGSPPRTWGILCVSDIRASASVHPHARGEYVQTLTTAIGLGRFTPTHVGNTRWPHQGKIAHRRFTPTHVGNTASGDRCRSGRYRFTPTHVGNTPVRYLRCRAGSPPRTWGIRSVATALAISANGSPPRTWGIRTVASWIELRRFTPTHVGNTGATTPRPRRFTPTHVGNTDADSSSVARPGFTPTHVGNTVATLRAASS